MIELEFYLGVEGVREIETTRPPVVAAGWPSPAEDYVAMLALNEDLMPRPEATFVLRVSGYSMAEVGISNGDEVLVDRSPQAGEGSIVVAVVDGEFTLKRLRIYPPRLEAASAEHADIPIGEDGTGIWGVVTTVIPHLL